MLLNSVSKSHSNPDVFAASCAEELCLELQHTDAATAASAKNSTRTHLLLEDDVAKTIENYKMYNPKS